MWNLISQFGSVRKYKSVFTSFLIIKTFTQLPSELSPIVSFLFVRIVSTLLDRSGSFLRLSRVRGYIGRHIAAQLARWSSVDDGKLPKNKTLVLRRTQGRHVWHNRFDRWNPSRNRTIQDQRIACAIVVWYVLPTHCIFIINPHICWWNPLFLAMWCCVAVTYRRPVLKWLFESKK